MGVPAPVFRSTIWKPLPTRLRAMSLSLTRLGICHESGFSLGVAASDWFKRTRHFLHDTAARFSVAMQSRKTTKKAEKLLCGDSTKPAGKRDPIGVAPAPALPESTSTPKPVGYQPRPGPYGNPSPAPHGPQAPQFQAGSEYSCAVISCSSASFRCC